MSRCSFFWLPMSGFAEENVVRTGHSLLSSIAARQACLLTRSTSHARLHAKAERIVIDSQPMGSPLPTGYAFSLWLCDLLDRSAILVVSRPHHLGLPRVARSTDISRHFRRHHSFRRILGIHDALLSAVHCLFSQCANRYPATFVSLSAVASVSTLDNFLLRLFCCWHPSMCPLLIVEFVKR